jgi:two-component system chemotaxis response regulator CheB
MPQNALRFVKPDRVLAAADIPAALVELSGKHMPMLVSENKGSDRETAMSEMEYIPEEQHPGKPSTYVCPECSGTLWEIDDDELMRFRCRVGHAYSPENMLEAKAEAAEASLWAALRSLEESASLSRRMAQRVSRGALRNRYLDDAESKMAHAATLRNVLSGFRTPPVEQNPIPADDGGGAGESRTGTTS